MAMTREEQEEYNAVHRIWTDTDALFKKSMPDGAEHFHMSLLLAIHIRKATQ